MSGYDDLKRQADMMSQALRDWMVAGPDRWRWTDGY